MTVTKTTRAVLLSPIANGPIVLEIYPDIVKTQEGADFYVGQIRYVVERVVDNDATIRSVYLKPPDEKAKQ